MEDAHQWAADFVDFRGSEVQLEAAGLFMGVLPRAESEELGFLNCPSGSHRCYLAH